MSAGTFNRAAGPTARRDLTRARSGGLQRSRLPRLPSSRGRCKQQPGAWVGLHHVGRIAAGVPGSRDALHRNEGRHPHLDARTGRLRGERARGQANGLGKAGAVGDGGAAVAQPVGQRGHGLAGLRRIRSTAGRHTLVSQSVRRPASAAVQGGRGAARGHRGCLRRADLAAVPRHVRVAHAADRGLAACRAGGGPGFQGDVQRGDRQRPASPPSSGWHRTGRAVSRGRRPLPAADPYQRGGRCPGQHGVRQQVCGLQFEKDPSPQHISAAT